MMASFFLFGLMASGSVVFAFISRDARVVKAATLFAAGWLIYALHWTRFGFAWLYEDATGFAVDVETVWSFCDTFIAITIMAMARPSWWSIVLVTGYSIQCAAHVLSQWGVMPDPIYMSLLNGVFVAQAAVFFTLGGGGLVDRLWNHLGRSVRRMGDLGTPRAPGVRRVR